MGNLSNEVDINYEQLQDVQIGHPVDHLENEEDEGEDLLAVDVDGVQEVAGVLVDVGLLHRAPTVFGENFDLVQQLLPLFRAKVLAGRHNVPEFAARAVVVVVVDVVRWNVLEVSVVVGAVFDLGQWRRPRF